MTHPIQMNNVKFWQIKTMTLFGLDQKSWIKMNNHLNFTFVDAKYFRNHVKTILKLPCFAYKKNWLAWFHPIWVKNIKKNVKCFWIFFQYNYSPKLYWIANNFAKQYVRKSTSSLCLGYPERTNTQIECCLA